jgi:ATP-dependent exoDNAse (exonuclease V) beta subunit
MPSKWARQDWQKEQERNLMYVAYTRAKRHLVFINLDGLQSAQTNKAAAA